MTTATRVGKLLSKLSFGAMGGVSLLALAAASQPAIIAGLFAERIRTRSPGLTP